MKQKEQKSPTAEWTENSHFRFCQIVFGICFVIAAGLIITGFILPPTGAIDGSILTSVGELLLFPTLLYGFRAIELGLEIKFQKGDTSIEISKDDN